MNVNAWQNALEFVSYVSLYNTVECAINLCSAEAQKVCNADSRGDIVLNSLLNRYFKNFYAAAFTVCKEAVKWLIHPYTSFWPCV